MSTIEDRRKERDDAKAALAEQHGLVGNPKLDMLFDLAWGYGHSYGIHEVEGYFTDMMPLIKE